MFRFNPLKGKRDFQVLQVSRICQIPMVEMQVAELVKLFLSVQFDESNCFTEQHNFTISGRF